jgi:hypothetical protein
MSKYDKSFGQRLSRAFEDSDKDAGPLVIFVRNVLGLVVLPIAMILIILLILGIISSPFVLAGLLFGWF